MMLKARDPHILERDRTDLEFGERPSLTIILAAPRGFCAGVRRAIDAVRDALSIYGPPVYVRRPIVHNLEVVRTLEAEGAIFVEELEQVPRGSVVLFSAHGVAPEIAREADRLGLIAFDAVCPLVSKVHREVQRHSREGRSVILIGHQGHPEIDGTLGHLPPGTAFVISSVVEVEALALNPDQPAAYAVQTTYSVDEASAIVAALRERFRDLAGPSASDICYATTNRQDAVRAIAVRADAIVVAGESFSSNARRLAELAAEHCTQVQLIADRHALDWSRIPATGTVGITAAASTPDSAVQGIISALSERFEVQLCEVESSTENTVFKRVAIS